MNIFSSDNFLGKFMNWIGNLVIINVLYIICSLPIFTIGASTTALYYSMMKYIRRDEGYVHTNFLRSFKENFKQSTIIWLIMSLVGFIIFLDLRIGMTFNGIEGGSIAGKCMIISSTILLIPYLFILLYIFPVQAKFVNPIKKNMLNSLLMATAHFGYTLLIILFIATFALLVLTSKAFIGLGIFCGFSLFAYITGNIYIFVFRKHLPDEFEDDLEARGEKKEI